MLQDFRYGLRQLRRSPGFAAVAILTLALGIGANTAIFSVTNAVMLRFLPVRDPQQLFVVRTTSTPNGATQSGMGVTSITKYAFEQLRGQTAVFADLIAYIPLSFDRVTVRYGALPEEAQVDMVSGNFFSGLGVNPVRGRGFTLDEETTHAPVAVLNYAWWTRRFGRNPSVLGQTLYVKGVPFIIVGIGPPDFAGVEGNRPTDLWIPLQDNPALKPWGLSASTDLNLYSSQNWWCLQAMARLAPGITERQAVAQLNPIFGRAAFVGISRPDPKERVPQLSLAPARGLQDARTRYQQPLTVLAVMVGLVLVIACANVAMLLAARNSAREREFSLRLAVGGSRSRIFRQLLAESLLLIGGGASLGWLFAMAAIRALSAWAGVDFNLQPDGTVLLFTMAVAALAGLVFCLAPMRSVARMPILPALKLSSATLHQDSGKARGSRAVVALQIALCLVLLSGAGLLVRTLRSLENTNLGMQTSGLLVFGVNPQQYVHSREETVRFYQTLLTRLRSLPLVESATLMGNRVGSGWTNSMRMTLDGQNGQPIPVRWNAVGPDYFHVLAIPLLLGRDFTDADSAATPRVAIVDEAFAKRYFPGRDPVGHTLAMSNRFQDAAPYTIAGVAAASKYAKVDETATPTAYFPYSQVGGTLMHIELRTAGNPTALLPAVRRAVADMGSDLALLQPMTQQEQFEKSFAQQRLVARLSMFFGLLAALLVAIGLYGTLSFTVSRRTAEVGVRMALGAQRGQVLWMVLRGSLLVSLAGIALGLPAAIGGARLLRSMLYGVEPGDWLTFAGALAGITVVTLAASLIPARRAASVDPMVALHHE